MKPNPIQFKRNDVNEPFPGQHVDEEGGSYDVNMDGATPALLARIEATIDLATSDNHPLKVTLINYPEDNLFLDEWLQGLYFYNICTIVLITTQYEDKVNEKQKLFDNYWDLIKSVHVECYGWPRFNNESSGNIH